MKKRSMMLALAAAATVCAGAAVQAEENKEHSDWINNNKSE